MKKNVIVLLIWGFIGIFSLVPLFPGETAVSIDVDYVTQLGDGASMNWTKQVIRVKGNGFGPERVKQLGTRKILAKRAAKMDAYRNLLEVIKGINITSNTKVEDMMLASDIINAKAQGMVKGMRIVDVTYTNDGGCEITTEVSINENGQFLLSALDKEEVKVKADNYPKFDWVILRTEWEKAKEELARTKTTLDRTKENLRSTQYALTNVRKELKQVKARYARLQGDFSKTRDQLLTSNLNLQRTESKLKHANLEKGELRGLFDTTKKELKNTKNIVKNLKDIMDSDIFELAEEDKQLSRARTYLAQDKKDVNELWKKVEALATDDMPDTPSDEELQNFVQRTKEIQQQTGRKLSQFYETQEFTSLPTSPTLPTENYTGLLIDARGLSIKEALAPSILTEKEEKIYGLGVMPETLSEGSIAAYLSGEVDSAKKHEKVGDLPLVIKAKKVVNGYDVIISDADIKKLASIYEQLEQQKVAILI